MSHFRGQVTGNNGASNASRLGSMSSGMAVSAMSYQGLIEVVMWHDRATGLDMVNVIARPHSTDVFSRNVMTLYSGPVKDARGREIEGTTTIGTPP